jgi:regulator of RNase E activity RraA
MGVTMKIHALNRPDQSMVGQFQKIETSTLADILDRLQLQGIMYGLRPIADQRRIVGPAVTVKEIACSVGTYSADDFPIGDVIDFAQPYDVLVFDNGGREISTWGGLASTAAAVKGIAGAIIDGGCRDIEQTVAVGFPICSRHVTPTPAKSRIKIIEMNGGVLCGGVKVGPGDIVVADRTGIVVVPKEKVQQVLEAALEIERVEEDCFRQLKSGRTFNQVQKKTGRL